MELVRALETGSGFSGESVFPSDDYGPLEPVAIEFKSLSSHEKSSIHWYDLVKSKLSQMDREGIITNAIVHGSYGDFTTTEFSDLELSLILNDDVIKSKRKRQILRNWLKKELNPTLLKIDPLQHHGVFYLSPEIIRCYDESILPLCAYKSSWAFSSERIIFRPVRGKRIQKTTAFDLTLESLSNYEDRFFSQGFNPYTIKRLISNILLVPAFFYQKGGVYNSKKDSIGQVYTIGNKTINDVLDVCSELRQTWPKPPVWLGLLRGFVTQGRIPSGRYHSGICGLYKSKRIENETSKYLLPILKDYCEAFRQLQYEPSNNQ